MSNVWGSSENVLKTMLNKSIARPLEKTKHFPVLDNLINLCNSNSSIVDLGCGTADVGRVYSDRKYLGMDLSVVIDNVSKIKNPTLNYKHFNIEEELPNEIKDYDIILMNGVLSEMKNPIDILKKILVLNIKYIIIHRQDFTNRPTYIKNYKSYCELTATNSYINSVEFEELIKNYNYIIQSKTPSNLDEKESVLLVKV